LISARDGSLAQLFPIEGKQDLAFGFVPGSRRMWIHNGAVTSVYELQ